VLVARAAERIEGALVAVVLIAPVAAVPRWVAGAETVRATQGGKVDIRAVMDRGAFDRGLFVTGDELSWIAAFDSWRDGDGRIVVRFDGSGLKDVRRVHPDLTAHSILEGDRIQSNKLAAPPPGVQFEIERAWPSFVRPSGDIGVKVVRSQSCCNFDTSGERFLFAFAAKAGSAVSVPFFVATAGRYALRVDGLVAPDYGTWAIAIDGAPLDTYEGFAEKVAPHKGNETVRDLSRGDHVLTLTCTGKRPESSNYLGGFDVLVGAPAP
jgi:hypothetical protein